MESHITFDTAKLAKEKHYMDGNRISKLFPKLGYVNCSPCYDEKGVLWNCKFYDPTDNYYLAPTQSKLQKWLRDIHKIHIIIIPLFMDIGHTKSLIFRWILLRKL